jgi:hypothetical protein
VSDGPACSRHARAPDQAAWHARSAHNGERAAAGLKAHELLKRSGSQWSDVIALALPAAEPHWRTVAKACCRHLDSLNVKERAFVQSMAARRGATKQLAWLARIYEDLQ